MSFQDIKIVEKGSGSVRKYLVDDRTTSGAAATIKAGEPVKRASDGSPFVILLADGDPERGTDRMVGIAIEESSETSTVDGEVLVFVPGPDTVLEAKATTAANVDTQAEIDALLGDVVSMDLTAGVFTLDENEGNDDNVHGFIIVGGDPDRQTLRFTVKNFVLEAGSVTGQTND